MDVSNADKIYFPDDGITKGEVVGYYARVAGQMLPYLVGRPLTLQRFPDGIGAKGFMQKNASKHFPESIERVEVPKEGGTTNHPVIDSEDDLVYLANQGTLTFHIWTSRLPDLDKPDRIVLDLDPAEGAEPPRNAALAARQVLEDIGLAAGITTTGSRGYHVVAPVVPEHDYEMVGHAARLLAEVVAARHPDDLTTEFRKVKREDRVFVDWLRNRWAQSIVSPWSVRPKAGAPVAMPIAWDELEATDPDRWTIATAPDRAGETPTWPDAGVLVPDALAALADENGVNVDEPFDRFRS